MSSEPTTTNQLATMVNSAIQNAMTMGESGVEAALIASQPWLGWPVIKQVFEFILGLVKDAFYVQAANAATKVIIDIQVGEEASAVNSAFQTAQDAIATGDQSAIDKASKDLDSAFGSIIHSDGSAPP